MQETGWQALLWSFVTSGLMTVSQHANHSSPYLITTQLAAYFFPVIFAIPLFGNYLAKEWLWSFTPSLSYVGQGIIMGYPITLSMNLVSL